MYKPGTAFACRKVILKQGFFQTMNYDDVPTHTCIERFGKGLDYDTCITGCSICWLCCKLVLKLNCIKLNLNWISYGKNMHGCSSNEYFLTSSIHKEIIISHSVLMNLNITIQLLAVLIDGRIFCSHKSDLTVAHHNMHWFSGYVVMILKVPKANGKMKISF